MNEDKLKLAGLELSGDGRIGNQVVMDLEEPGEYIEIPLYTNKEEKVNPDDVIRARMEEVWYK